MICQFLTTAVVHRYIEYLTSPSSSASQESDAAPAAANDAALKQQQNAPR